MTFPISKRKERLGTEIYGTTSLSEPLIVDTDVIIDFLRGMAEALSFFMPLKQDLLVSTVTVTELYTGVREGKERGDLEEFLAEVSVAEFIEKIAVVAGLFRRQFMKSHGVGLADAMIVATALHHGATLITLNLKHFPMIQNVIVPYVKAS